MNTAAFTEIKKNRIRNPRYFGSDGRLKPYDAGAAYAQLLLNDLADGKFRYSFLAILKVI
jgi:hypothetical protein